MNSKKVIIYCNDYNHYSGFITECEKRYELCIQIESSVNLLRELLNSNEALTVIFIENHLNSTLSDHILEILKHQNFYCVSFSNSSILDNVDLEHINDYLECDHPIKVTNFINRMERNLFCRGNLMTDYQAVNGFYKIAKQLTLEKDLNTLLNLILDHSMTTTKADAGTLFIIVDEDDNQLTYYEKNSKKNRLKFMISKNNSLETDLVSTTMVITGESIIGDSVISGKPIRIDDAYHIDPINPYKFNDSFDNITGYKTQSILTIPMKDHEDRVIGVIQLINKIEDRKITTFTANDESIINSLTGLGAVVIDHAILYRDLNQLIDKNRDIVIHEINKRKSADEEINKLLSAIELSPVGVMITDVNGNIRYVNPKFEHLTGYKYSEAIGKNPRILKSDLYDGNYYSDLWSTILSGLEWHGELYEKKKDGSYYWANCHIASVKTEDNIIKYFVAVQEDITGKKLLMTEIEDKNVALEETIIKLNLSQMQVIQSEKLAGIGQLAAGVAHEINNPLAFVTSNFRTIREYINELVQVIKSDGLSNVTEDKTSVNPIHNQENVNEVDSLIEDITEMLEESEEGLVRVGDIVKALRVFSTVDENEAYQYYDMNMNIDNTLTLMKSEIGDINIIKEFQNVPLIKVISKEINQVILNLLRNSLYAVKEKNLPLNELCITIKTYSDKEYLTMDIIDNGCGIESEVLKKIFDPFFTTKPIGVGTGLGLGIVYDVITKKHHGKINCTSEVGVGTVFTVSLPIL